MQQQRWYRRSPKTQHPAAEQRRTHCKQSQCYRAASLWEQRTHYHLPTEDPLHYCRQLVFPNFSLARSVLSRKHTLATFVYKQLQWSLVDQSPEQSETEWLFGNVARYKIINVYKPPRSQLTPTAILTFPHPSLYVGEFNWGYSKTSSDGQSLDSWATSNSLGLLYNSKGAARFSSHRWNVSTNPDLAFASVGHDNRLPNRQVRGNFLWSQHRPSLIKPPRLKFLPTAIRFFFIWISSS